MIKKYMKILVMIISAFIGKMTIFLTVDERAIWLILGTISLIDIVLTQYYNELYNKYGLLLDYFCVIIIGYMFGKFF